MSKDTTPVNERIAGLQIVRPAQSIGTGPHASVFVPKYDFMISSGYLKLILFLQVEEDGRKVVNMFQFKCDPCMENARSRSYRWDDSKSRQRFGTFEIHTSIIGHRSGRSPVYYAGAPKESLVDILH